MPSSCFDFFYFYDLRADPEPGLIFVVPFPASLPRLSLYLSTPPSSFERLSRSLARGSNQPLACIGQPFEVVPGRQKPCDSPRSPNRYGVQMCPSPLLLSQVFTLLLFYSLVLHSSRPACGRHRPFDFIAYICPPFSPTARGDKTQRRARAGKAGEERAKPVPP